MMWKWCVVLVMIFACSAQLVNLVEPHMSIFVPQPQIPFMDYWKLFDYDKSTSQTVRKNDGVELRIPEAYFISPTNYVITMAANVQPADYPSSWNIIARKTNFDRKVLDDVTGAVFENGVYEGTLRRQIDLIEIKIKFQQDVTIAEIELLGPQSALDALWPYGDYPCSQRLAVITSKSGPSTIFSKSKNVVSQEDLREIFDANAGWTARAEFGFDGTKPVIIGAKLPSVPMVQEVSVTGDLFDDGVLKVVLQGSFCEDNKCRKFGSKGWVRLGVGRPERRGDGFRIHVENPAKYKAYRLKFIPRTGHPTKPDPETFTAGGLWFLGCKA